MHVAYAAPVDGMPDDGRPVLGSILGKGMMQGEVTIESFPSYPCPRAINNKQTNILLFFFNALGSKRGIDQRSDWLEEMISEEGASRQ